MSHQMRNLSKSLPSPYYSKDMKEENEQHVGGHNSVDAKQQYSYQNSTNNENFTYDSASDSETAARNYNNQYNKPSSNFFHSSHSNNMNRYSKLASHAHNSYVSRNLTDGDEDNDQAGDYSNNNINNRHRHDHGGVEDDDGDDDIRDNESVDEFNLNVLKHPFHTPSLNNPSSQLSLNKVVKTGRQRKKEAARSKGGEFQAKRKKKRIYFCCVSSEIDVEKLYDYFITSGGLTKDKEWSLKMYSDVLHLHKPGNSNSQNSANEMLSPRNSARLPSAAVDPLATATINNTASIVTTAVNAPFSPTATTAAGLTAVTVAKANEEDTHTRISTYGSQEVFIFDFGAIVFWGFSRGDEEPFLKNIRMFVTKGYVEPHEFPSGEDDMAFVCTGNSNSSSGRSSGGISGDGNESHNSHTTTVGDRSGMTTMMLGSIDEGGDAVSSRAAVSSSSDGHNHNAAIVPLLLHPASDILFQPLITIANDVLTIPEDTPAKQRMSLSFAIAQSAVLSIFESRIDRKIVEYKYIPETMAKHGRIHLNERQLGTMIGEVFVIRHDVNLHTEILDTPDFFWKDGEKYEKDYKLIMRYLEMGARTEVLNKRLDMMRELLDVLQQQMENDHGVKLEWIVIWLIVVEVVLQMIAIAVDSLAWKSTHSIV